MRSGNAESYHLYSTPFGFGAILFQKDPFLVKRIFLPLSGKRALINLVQDTALATPAHTAQAQMISADLEAYFAGLPIEPPWNLLDLSNLTPLQRSVLRATADVPYGHVRTYGYIAQRIGRPRAYRFTGTALALNPFPLVIPCHRIIRSDGSAGHYSGGSRLKQLLLKLERDSSSEYSQ